MTVAFIVITLRLVVPLTILRWPLGGALLALIADIYDFVLLNSFGWGFLTSETYQPIDKLFDIYYLSFEAFIASKWTDSIARKTALTLFSWRLVGVTVFELTGTRKFLFFAPNIFEYFYLTVITARKFITGFRLNRKLLFFLLIAIGIPKLLLEYILHYLGYPLGIANSWEFIKEVIFR